MGFFQELKEDLSQAVNELLPEEETGQESKKDDEDKALDDALKEVQEALAAEVGSPDNEEAGKQDEAAEETKDAETADEEKQEEKQDDQAAEEEPKAESAAPEDEEQVVETEEPEVVKEEAEAAEPVDETEAVEEPSEKAAEESEAVMLQKAAAEQMQSIAGIVKPEADADEDDFAERQMQTPEEMLMHMDLGQHTEKEESELEKEVGKAMEEQKMSLEDTEVLDETAIITAGMTLNGDISAKGNVDILGKVKGKVELLGKLNVSGTIEGDSKAAEVFADGAHITGMIVAEGTVKIGQNSVVIGNVAASSAVIAGAVKGDIDVKGPVILDASAIVMGNIKSKSVQINNGAVIEGMCSQCYAEVNPTDFFNDLIAK
jgi:cytoskeletal protein CcmA (bactofilin family)